MSTTVTVDIGTTGVKLCLFDEAGDVLASERHPTPTTPDAWGEVYELDVLTGHLSRFLLALRPAHRSLVQKIAITGVGESGALVRADQTLASPMILWHDRRGATWLDRLDAEDEDTVYRITGLPLNAAYGVSKAAWAVRHSPDTSGAQWLNVAEYLAALMSGRRWSEYSLASRTMALDLRRRDWSGTVCALFGLTRDVFPVLRPASEGSPVTARYASRHHLPEGVHVHVAGHDHMVGGAGAALAPGELLNSTGTTEGLLYLRDQPDLGPSARAAKLTNGIACGGDGYTLFASIPTGGSAFATLQGLLGHSESTLTAVLAAQHRRYLAGGTDLDRIPLVLPQFRGSAPPSKQPDARGLVAGIAGGTTLDDLVLGCFLGLAMQFQDVLDLFGQRPDVVKVIGPASRNPLWLQLKADLLGLPLSVSTFPEVVSRGARALAWARPETWSRCDPYLVSPDPRRHERLLRWRRSVASRWRHLQATPT